MSTPQGNTPSDARSHAPSYREQVRRDLRVRCLHLVTKESFVGLPAPHELGFPDDGPLWWCDRTSGAFGPDDAPVETDPCHGRCASARACYDPPLRP